MPIYEYQCDDCEYSFETLVRPGRDDDAACPSCEGVRLHRKLSTFASGRGSEDTVSASGPPGPSGGGCCGGGCGCH